MHALGISLAGLLAAAVASVQPALAQSQIVLNGASLGGNVLPTTPVASDLQAAASRGWLWKVDDTQRLYLEGDVTIAVAGYRFRAQRAALWINRLPLGGSTATQIAIWFDRADESTRRAGLGASGKELLVTATISGTTQLSLSVTEQGTPDRRLDEEPSAAARDRRTFVAAGETRLARYLGALAHRIETGAQRVASRPQLDFPKTTEEPAPVVGGRLDPAIVSPPKPAERGEREGKPPTDSPAIFGQSGTVSFSASSITIDEKADRISVQGSVEIEYIARGDGAERVLQLSAERAVIFLSKGAVASLRTGARAIDSSIIEGIYLEGAVEASDGEYALRGARIYYDLPGNRAAIVDALLRTYDRSRRDMPINVRAAEMRQVAREQWTAERATVSTSEFFTPHLAIGVDRVTVTKAPPDAGGGVFVASEGTALEAGGARILPLPSFNGRFERIPIRSLEAGYDEDRGVEIGTAWDLPTLLGQPAREGFDGELLVDGYTERGAGVGTLIRLSDSLGKGTIDLYGLYDTGGTDRTSSGESVDIDPGMRGIADIDWRYALDSNLLFRAQTGIISDETFVSAWRERDFEQRREYETSAELVRTSDNTSLSLFAKTNANDFLSNSYLIASRGYAVDKLPEFLYSRYGDEPIDGLTWTQQWSAAMMRLRPGAGTPVSLGIPTGAWGGAVGANEDLEQAYADAGYNDGGIGRLDTRHEFSLPMTNGWANFTPFVSGEATGYIGDELDTYTSGVEDIRLQAAGGVRGSMRFVHVDDSVQSRALDLNRMRHIVEPYGTAWYGWDSLERGELPIYDQAYEGTSAATVGNIGVRQTFQTQRGGSGAWQSVDWLKLDLGLVMNDKTDDFTPEPVNPLDPNSSLRWVQSPIPAFYSFRPELSQWGSHSYGSMVWQLSDALTVGGTANYLFDDRTFITDDAGVLPNLARASLGIEMRHNPVASTYIEYRYIAPTASELLQLGVLYRVGKRYLVSFSPQYDISEGDFRSVTGAVTRTFPDFDMNADAGYDLVMDRTFFSISLSIPAGSGSQRPGFGNFTPTAGGMP